MNPDICNIHPQIRIYVYALADPRRSAGSDWIWSRTPRCSPPGGAARVPDFKTLRWLDHHLWKEDPDPQNLVSCLNTTIWDGIMAQDPEPALLPLGGAAQGPDPNPDGGPDPNSVLNKENCYFLCWKNPGSLFWARKSPCGRAHTHSLFLMHRRPLESKYSEASLA